MNFVDKDILAGIRAGDENSVLRVLYDELLPYIKNMIISNSGTDDDAFDVFQEGILVFYKYVKTNKFNETHKIESFVYAVCKNIWLNKLKKEARNTRLDDNMKNVLYEPDLSKEIAGKDKLEKMNEALSSLGPRCKQLLSLMYFEQMSMKEIAVKMGFSSENAVKTKNYKCKQRLIKFLNENPGIKKIFRQ